MIVTPTSQDLDFLASDLQRSPGVHASDIYGDLFAFLDPKRYDHEGNPNPVLMALGTAWEKHLEYLLEKNGVKALRPGELMSPEGLAYSPDLIIFNGVTRCGEIKLTSMSSKDMPEEETDTLPPKLDKYLCQLKLYCYWLELLHGWLGMVFNYRPFDPDFRAYNLTFTPRELQENHQMCMNHARSRGLLK